MDKTTTEAKSTQPATKKVVKGKKQQQALMPCIPLYAM